MIVEIIGNQCYVDYQQEVQCQYDDGWVVFDEIGQWIGGEYYGGDGYENGNYYDRQVFGYVDGGDDVVD